jgi:hypothetical protein
MKPLTDSELLAIEANLFPLARPLVRGRPSFPWHRDRRRSVTASRVESSQALAVDFFVTINALGSRDAIVNTWMAELGLPFTGPWELDVEVLVPRRLLGEPRPTQLDAVAVGSNGVVLFECKFTEPDGGCCSQPIPIAKGRNRGSRQCNGSFTDQINPVTGIRSRCTLTGKGVRYWELIPNVLNVDATSDHRPCPFAGGRYQWMRNLVSAFAMGIDRGLPSAFVVTYTDGPFPIARKVTTDDWTQLTALAQGRAVPLRTTSYQRLHALAMSAAFECDRPVLAELRAWIERKATAVAGAAGAP